MKVKQVLVPDANAESGFSPNGRYSFICPGCGDHHEIPTKTPLYNGACWGFNGNVDNPTFTPSLLVRSGHYVPGHESDHCWCTYNKEQVEKGEDPASFTCHICHSFITDGKIQFLGDCTHHLAGKTVELPDVDQS